MRTKPVIQACAVMLCAAMVVVIGEAAYSLYVRSRAESFVEQFEQLRIHAISRDKALERLKTYTQSQKPSQLCDSAGCYPGYEYEFRDQSVLRLIGRPGILVADMYFHNDTLVAKHVVMLSGAGCCFASIKESESSDGSSNISASLVVLSNGTPNGVNVWIGPTATDKQRTMGYKLNYNCLLPFSKCSSAHDMFGGYWAE